MEMLREALEELYIIYGNHKVVVTLSEILDKYVAEAQRERLENDTCNS